MRRFFCESITNTTAVITGDDAHHIARVLRMKAGDALSLCDGAGNEYDAVITGITQDAISCTVGERRASEATISELVAKYGVHQTVIHSWKRQALEGMAAIFSSKTEAKAAEKEGEIEKLHAKIGQLVVERDFLVKASGR